MRDARRQGRLDCSKWLELFLNIWNVAYYATRHRLTGDQKMPARRSQRMALSQLFGAGSALVFGVWFLIEPAHAQPGVSFPNPPTQMFTPSTPSAVPQRSLAPLSYTTPNVVPAHNVMLPLNAPRTSVDYPRLVHVVEARSSWSPGYYDYAPGQMGRGRPHHGGYARRAGYHGD